MRFHRLAETVPSSPKPKPRAKKQLARGPRGENSPLRSTRQALTKGSTGSGDFETAMFAQNIVVKSTGGKIFPEEWGRIGKPGVPPYATRLSFHVFNSEEDVRRMVDAIDSFLRK